MGMIRRADIETYARNAVAMNLGDIERQGEALMQLASERAEQTLQEAQAERERLVAGAAEQGHKEGFDQGHREGVEKGHQEGFDQAHKEHAELMGVLAEQWAMMLKEFSDARDTMYQHAREDVVLLGIEIAKKITGRTIELDPTAVETQMQSVLETLAHPTGLVLRVHPDDLAYAEKVLPGLIADCLQCTHAEVCADDSIERGSCTAETDGRGKIDASIQTQLKRVVEAILPTDASRDEGARADDARGQEQQGDAA